jgi:hypothetical protein
MNTGQDNIKDKLDPVASARSLRSGLPGQSDPVGTIDLVKRPPQPVDTVMGCRYELKYYVSESKAQAVMAFVQTLLPVDKYSEKLGGAYPISTLYLDSHNLQLCRESIEGHKNRFKLRIRSYTDDPSYPCFLEIKRRMNGICMKDRARMSPASVPELFSGTYRDKTGENDHAFNQFMLYLKTINAGPMMKVRYNRFAFEGKGKNRVRVTFDRQIACKAVTAPDVSLNGPGWQYLSGSGVVLEIKFTDKYPQWLHQLVSMFGLQRQSFSKYARSIEQCGMLGFCAPRVPVRIVDR